jgi:hypothetical protein
MANNSIRAIFEPLRTVAGTAITGSSYIGIGSPLANPCHLSLIQNLTDQLLLFSIDGVNDHFALPAGGFFLPDITANRTDTGGALFIAQGTRFYVRAPATDPTTGAVYVTTVFGFQND